MSKTGHLLTSWVLSMSELSKEKLRIKRNSELRDELRARFPGAFPSSNKDTKVLAIGITESLVTNGYLLEEIKDFLRSYCHRHYYYEAFLTQDFRVDLNGDPTTEITEEQKAMARERLEVIAAKQTRKQQSKKLAKEAKAKKAALSKSKNDKCKKSDKNNLKKNIEVINKTTGRRVLVLSKKV
jgi:sRNA-binding protein